MDRKAVIAQCKWILDRAKGTAREDDDGTILEEIWEAEQAAKAHPDVLKRFKAAIQKTEFA